MLKRFYKYLLQKYPKIHNFIFNFINKYLNKNKIIRKGKDNKTSIKNSFLYKSDINIIGKNNEIIIRDAYINNLSIYIYGNNNKITIYENVKIRGGSLWIENNCGEIIIAKNTSIESAHLAVTENNRKIIIGENCMLSHDIEIRTGDSHSIIDLENNRRINYAKDVILGSHVWICAHTKILKGVKIAKNNVIALGSIVTKEFKEENCIIAGQGKNCNIIKRNVTWTHDR